MIRHLKGKNAILYNSEGLKDFKRIFEEYLWKNLAIKE
jgi:hypothetical protein